MIDFILFLREICITLLNYVKIMTNMTSDKLNLSESYCVQFSYLRSICLWVVFANLLIVCLALFCTIGVLFSVRIEDCRCAVVRDFPSCSCFMHNSF